MVKELDKLNKKWGEEEKERVFMELASQFFELDILELLERYGKVVRDFQRFLMTNTDQMVSEERFRTSPNPLEEVFLAWLEKSGRLEKMDSEELSQFREARSKSPLKCQFRDFLFNLDKERQVFKVPELTPDMVKTALVEYIRNHPREFQD
jgi:hypothetical protein